MARRSDVADRRWSNRIDVAAAWDQLRAIDAVSPASSARALTVYVELLERIDASGTVRNSTRSLARQNAMNHHSWTELLRLLSAAELIVLGGRQSNRARLVHVHAPHETSARCSLGRARAVLHQLDGVNSQAARARAFASYVGLLTRADDEGVVDQSTTAIAKVFGITPTAWIHRRDALVGARLADLGPRGTGRYQRLRILIPS